VHDVDEPLIHNTLPPPVQIDGQLQPIIDLRERNLDRRSAEIDRRERELERRERELERRERELDRRERAFDDDKMRWAVTTRDGALHWQNAIEALRKQIDNDFLEEQKKNLDREADLEAKILKKVDDKLDKDRRSRAIDLSSD